jgi:DNA-directed RNA polymerase specialized sigma24 family protein
MAEPDSQRTTLGHLLYASKTRLPVSEDTWVGLVQSIAARDQLALRALYARTDGVVFTWIMGMVRSWETAEDLTLDVFHDVWRTAARYDPASGSVVGWVMDKARSRAIGRPSPATIDVVSSPADLLWPSASRWELLARRIAAETGEEPLVPAPERRAEPEWLEVAPGISCKLLATDTEHDRVSMLVWLAPGASYPPHRHAGVEELYLLHGELMIENRKLYPGDYSRAAPGTGDLFVWSGTGCMCVLLTSARDVLRNAPPTATEALRAVIRHKLQDSRLPHHIPRFWGGPGEGQTCDACDRLIAEQMLVQGIARVGWDRRPIQMHVDCFAVWDQERPPQS